MKIIELEEMLWTTFTNYNIYKYILLLWLGPSHCVLIVLKLFRISVDFHTFVKQL